MNKEPPKIIYIVPNYTKLPGKWLVCSGEDVNRNDYEYVRKITKPKRPHIVCLCGSTRFMSAFFEAGRKFTLEGKIVLSVGVCKHTDAEGGCGTEVISQDVADRLDELHLRKIDLADAVVVLNVGGYIGNSTRKEITYAERTGKPVHYLEKQK